MPEPPKGQLGPVARLKRAFETDPVDPEAIRAERLIRAQFGTSEAPAEILKSVHCRKRACKVELRWLADKPFGYMGAGMLISANVNPDMAVEASGVPDKNGVLRYDLYVARDGYQPSDYEPVPAPAPATK